MNDVKIKSVNCTETCPEDCEGENVWTLLESNNSPLVKAGNIKLSCSRKPSVTKTVKECMEDFDVSNHPNMHLLPDECGKQSTGRLSTVIIHISLLNILIW
jgi:hypothetical protein